MRATVCVYLKGRDIVYLCTVCVRVRVRACTHMDSHGVLTSEYLHLLNNLPRGGSTDEYCFIVTWEKNVYLKCNSASHPKTRES